MNKIMAVILTYNKKGLLLESIENLLDQTIDNFDILIVDNNSNDGTKEALTPFFKNLRVNYVNTNSNLGGAGGFSFGIEYAMKMNQYKYLWIMDDDTLPVDNSLEELIKVGNLVDNKFGFLCSQVLFTNGDLCNMNKQIIDNNWFVKSKYLNSGILSVKKASFVSCFINVEAIKQLGLPIADFFIWYDDTEYTARISNKYPSYLVSKSVVYHKMKSNISLDISNDTPERMNRYKLAYRNYFYIARREGLKAEVRFYKYILKTIINIVKSGREKKINKIWIVISSVVRGWFFHPKIRFVKS